jgi:hypothetical protein
VGSVEAPAYAKAKDKGALLLARRIITSHVIWEGSASRLSIGEKGSFAGMAEAESLTNTIV